jgi:2-polyprenyl-3-methyl-5-hydroxy-6-metoxy-1,4-benzoquinol methylase
LNNVDQKVKLSRSQKIFIKNLLKYVGDSKSILDAGCGSGWLGSALGQYLSAQVVAIDVKAPQFKPRVNHFALMDVHFLGFLPQFDLIIAKDIIEHVLNPRNAMKEFALMLKENGVIIITVPSPQAPFLWDDYTHIRPFTKKSLSQLLFDSGFEPILIKNVAAPTSGAALLRMTDFWDALANLGFRKGNVLAVARKKKYPSRS